MPLSTRYHHVAFGTKDIEKTYDFYANRLGLPLSHCENHLSGKGWFKHFFFDVGGGEQLGFFAFANVGEKESYRTDISTGLGLPPWVNHVAFNVRSMDDIQAMKRRAQSNGVELEGNLRWANGISLNAATGVTSVHYTGNTTLRGKRVPQVPSYNAGTGIQYTRQPCRLG